MKKPIVPIIALISATVLVVAGAVFAMSFNTAKHTEKPSASDGVNASIKTSLRDAVAPEEKRIVPKKVNEVTEQTTAPEETTVEETKAPVENNEPSSDGNKTLEYAKAAVEKCTNSNMSREEKLKAAFDYLKSNYLEGVRRDDYREPDWPEVYANDIFVYGKGDCFSYGAAFAYMAKAIGYTDAYACNSGGHGWAEVNGKVYDPEWSMHSNKYSYFGMSYDQECDVPYKTALGTADWMHIQV